jgi:ABC-2 type transport system permease protein
VSLVDVAPGDLAGEHSGESTGELRRALSLTWTLGITEWKLRFYGSLLGYFWMLARPFAFFGVIYVVFTEIANVGNNVQYYGVYILFALVLFSFFGEVTGACVQSLAYRENLLRKMKFPTIVVPLSVALTGLLNVTVTLLAVLVFALGSGVEPRWSWLELPMLVLLLGVLALGVGMLLSVLYVRYRDMQPIWEVVSQMLFYASPVLYVATSVPSEYQAAYLCNPIAAVLTQMRHSFIDPKAPSLGSAMGADWRVVIPLALIAGVLALGIWAFKREAPRIAEHL